MSWPPAPEKAALETLLGDLISYYKERVEEGRLGVCRQAALTQRAGQLLGTGAPSWLHLPEEIVFALGGSCLGVPSPAPKVCQELVRALEFLELISVNLLLFPWRKEIRSLKMYTGSFTYWVRPWLSRHTLDTILGKLGYVAISEAEFSLIQAVSEEDTKQMMFEIFLARVACEATLGNTGKQVLGPGKGALSRPTGRHGSERMLVEVHSFPKGARPGLDSSVLQEGPSGRSHKAPDGSTGSQRSLPRSLSLSEPVSTATDGPLTGLLVPCGPQHCASTLSNSEEFLTCYNDLVLHRTPALPKDTPEQPEGKPTPWYNPNSWPFLR